MLLSIPDAMWSRLKEHISDNNYCFLCDQHPGSKSHGHHKKCPLFVADDRIRTYTDAPSSCDGFGTETEEDRAGEGPRGTIRTVLTPKEHVQRQRDRYSSAEYIHASDEQFDLACRAPFPLVKRTQ